MDPRNMTGADAGVVETVWPVVVIGGVVLALIWLAVRVRVFGGTHLVCASFHCPVTGDGVSVDWEVNTRSGRRVNVASCSAFDPPKAVACDRTCIRTRVPVARAA